MYAFVLNLSWVSIMYVYKPVNSTTPETTAVSVHTDLKLILLLGISITTTVFISTVLLLDFILRRITNQRRRMDSSLRSNWHKFFPPEYDPNRRVSVMNAYPKSFTDLSLDLSDISERFDVSDIDHLSELSIDISSSLNSSNLSIDADSFSTEMPFSKIGLAILY